MKQCFTEFLVSQGAIDAEEGASVRAWAHQSRDLLGTIAMDHGILDGEQIRAVVSRQREGGEMFGDVCVELGFMGRRELDVLLGAQDLRTIRCEAERLMLLGAVGIGEVEGLLSGFYGSGCDQGGAAHAA